MAPLIGLIVQGVFLQTAYAQTVRLEPPKQLKPLYLETSLVSSGSADIIIVAPSARYGAAVKLIRDRIAALSGVTLTIVDDKAELAASALSHTNVIALGNMHTNGFIEDLYRKWYVLLDARYPGIGGYVVRTLHNPLGTGHNVIFVGGSDDAGVLLAAQAFVKTLRENDPLTVGRLALIRLGTGMVPPALDLTKPQSEWNVFSWRDSWRQRSNGTSRGYPPSTFFGWNPISIAGILYYMTGNPVYMAQFKAMALPDPAKVPVPNISSEAIFDPLDPLVDNYHYNSHLVDWVFDLIEESPLLSDAERLAITTKLYEHQIRYDPTNTYRKSVPSRHASWQLMGIYTGSRYFATYYPNPIWQKRLDNVRESFANFLVNPSWGERDTLHWVSTSLEPVFEFFLVDGYREFADSGMAETLISALIMLDDGTWRNDYNRFVAMSLLHKASYILNTPRYFEMARKLGFNDDVFRIGQSYWWSGKNLDDPPPPGLRVYPLPRSDWMRSGHTIELNRGFQLLSYHEGFSARDDYILLDGFFGGGRNEFHVNTLYRLRLQGKNFLSGYGNDVEVWRDGMMENVGRAAELQTAMSAGNIVYVESGVTNSASARSRRHLLYVRDNLMLVLDRITAINSGDFEITTNWQVASDIHKLAGQDLTLVSGAHIVSSDLLHAEGSSHRVQQLIHAPMASSESVSIVHLFINGIRQHKSIVRIRPGVFAIRGTRPGVVASGPMTLDAVAADSNFLYVDNSRIVARRIRSLVIGGTGVLEASVPVDIIWDLSSGHLVVEADSVVTMSLDGSGSPPAGLARLDVGHHSWRGVVPKGRWFTMLKDNLAAPGKMDGVPLPAEKMAQPSFQVWPYRWSLDLGQPVTALALPRMPSGPVSWVVTEDGENGSQLWRVNLNGKALGSTRFDSPVTSLWTPRSVAQAAAFTVLVGFRNDTLTAVSSTGTPRWEVSASIHPSFVVGNHYEAPGFTDPALGHTGIFSLLVGDLWGRGSEEIVLGRPSTVEFRSLAGKLIKQVRTQWGDNRSLLLLDRRGGIEPMVLVGKNPSGQPGFSVINAEYENLSDTAFGSRAPGEADMSAWRQRGVSDSAVADLDGDGVQEVIYTLSGHWNELRVYNGASEALRWQHHFGPSQSADFMRGLVIADVNSDGLPDVIVANNRGWIHAFDGNGRHIWQKKFRSAVSVLGAVTATDGGKKIVAGFESGKIVLLGASGEIEKQSKLPGAIVGMDSYDGSVLVGTNQGRLAMFDGGMIIPVNQ